MSEKGETWRAIADTLNGELQDACARAEAAEAKLALLDSPDLLEVLAAYEHNYHWAGWEQYRNEKAGQLHPSGETYEARWLRQRNTWYADLPEEQKESDREEVRHYLVVLREFLEKKAKTQ